MSGIPVVRLISRLFRTQQVGWRLQSGAMEASTIQMSRLQVQATFLMNKRYNIHVLIMSSQTPAGVPVA